MKEISSLLILYSVCLTACGDKKCLVEAVNKSQGYELHITKDRCRDDQIVTEQEFLRTSNGTLIADGYYKEYFDDGSIQSIAFFKQDKQDSIAIRYYKNGNKELEFYWEDGIQVGFQNVFYPNGQYQRRDYYIKDSLKMFLVTYKSNGNIEHFEGAMFRVSYDKDVDGLRCGENIFITTEVVQIDKLQSQLSIEFYSPSKRKIVDTAMVNFTKFGNREYFLKMYNLSERGLYHYTTSIKLVNMADGRILKKDSTEFTITVK